MNSVIMNEWIEVGRLEEIPPVGSRVVRTPRGDVAVFRAGDDSVFAVDDRCPHKGGPLSQGIVYGHTVSCPLHGMCIDLATGCAVAPDEGKTESYAAKVEAGKVYIKMPNSK